MFCVHYGKDAISTDDIKTSLYSKELMKKVSEGSSGIDDANVLALYGGRVMAMDDFLDLLQ